MRFHLEMRTRANMAAGMETAAAVQSARRHFGNLESIKESCRDVRGGGWLETFWQDLRFAARMLLRDRGFSAVAVLVLALTIGANTAVFTVVSRVLLRPLPFVQPDRIFSLWHLEANRPAGRVAFSYPDFLEYRAQNRWFDSLGIYSPATFVLSSGEGQTTPARGARVSASIFEVLGVPAALGRTFVAADDEPGRRAAVISYDLWQRRFGGAPGVLGASFAIDGRPHRIIGVMPRGFDFPIQNKPVEVWTTTAMALEPTPEGGAPLASRRRTHQWRLIGRLKDGVSEEEARAGLSAVAAKLATQYPYTNGWIPACGMASLLADSTGTVRPPLLLLLGAALCVLGVGCATLSNLSLARMRSRTREFALRAALGAGRRRIAGQLLTESLLLAGMGGLAGLLAATAGTRFIVAMLPADFPRALEITPDVRVLLFTGLVTLATTVLVGFAPAWRSARADLTPLFRDGSRESGRAVKASRALTIIVGCEIVLTFVILACAGFLLRGLWRLENTPPGFSEEDLLTFHVSPLAHPAVSDAAQWAAPYAALLREVQTLRGVQSASLSSSLPFTGRRWGTDFAVSGRPQPLTMRPKGFGCIVSPGYFRAMGTSFVAGRDFAAEDRSGAPEVAIINEAFARIYFPNQNPLGQRIAPGIFSNETGLPEREIIGVAANAQFDNLVYDEPGIYVPHAQVVERDMRLIVRSELTARAILPRLQEIAARLDPPIALFEPDTMEDHLESYLAQPRLNSILLAAYAALALLLTGIGVYGVTAYSVAHERQEIGIRLALGASPHAVFRHVVGRTVRILACALPAGALLALLAMSVVRGAVEGAGMAAEVLIVPSVALFVAGVALAGCWWPARRAMQVDPLIALRCE